MNIQKSAAEGEMESNGMHKQWELRQFKSATPLTTTVAAMSASHTGITTGPDHLRENTPEENVWGCVLHSYQSFTCN